MENLLKVLNATLPWRVRWYHEGGESYDEGAIVEFNFNGHSKQKMNCDVMVNKSLKSVKKDDDEEEQEELWNDWDCWELMALNQCFKYWRHRVGVTPEFNAWHVAKVLVDNKWISLDNPSLLPSFYRSPNLSEAKASLFLQEHPLDVSDGHYNGLFAFCVFFPNKTTRPTRLTTLKYKVYRKHGKSLLTC